MPIETENLAMVGLLIVALSTSCAPTHTANESKRGTIPPAVIEISRKHADGLGYKTAKMAMKVELKDVPWNYYLPRESDTPYVVCRRKLLAGRTYWMVSYHPVATQLGGDLAVFIDYETHEILTDYRGQ